MEVEVKDKHGVVIHKGDFIRYEGTIVKRVVSFMPNDDETRKCLCINGEGLDIPFIPGYEEHIPLVDLETSKIEVIK